MFDSFFILNLCSKAKLGILKLVVLRYYLTAPHEIGSSGDYVPELWISWDLFMIKDPPLDFRPTEVKTITMHCEVTLRTYTLPV